ncbi:hypothetical protein AOQ72_05285 [Bradyrhizobium yuanmingense]|uniref:Uncharacterized protein n=1 Tax=Bradyrhizobium yuanmingense TaxID=108015 RepID=A0A0R3BQY9_9BRAD|nr:hypothetical protein AOQ72_05285 [Bradyrhizobium yuanmingense]
MRFLILVALRIRRLADIERVDHGDTPGVCRRVKCTVALRSAAQMVSRYDVQKAVAERTGKKVV